MNSENKLAALKLSGREGVEIDHAGALKILEERVEYGDSEAMWILGMCCDFGIGCEPNLSKAKSLYEQSKSRGNHVGRFFSNNGDPARKYRGEGAFIVGQGLFSVRTEE